MARLLILLAAAAIFAVAPALAQTPDPQVPRITDTPSLTAAEVKGVLRERDLKPLVADFIRLQYTEHKGREAFAKYVAENIIEHDPDFPDGRDSSFKFMQHRFEKANREEFLPIEQWRIVIDQVLIKGDLLIMRLHAFQRKNDRGRIFANFWRWEGNKIVEHWDVITDVPQNKTNPRTEW